MPKPHSAKPAKPAPSLSTMSRCSTGTDLALAAPWMSTNWANVADVLGAQLGKYGFFLAHSWFSGSVGAGELLQAVLQIGGVAGVAPQAQRGGDSSARRGSCTSVTLMPPNRVIDRQVGLVVKRWKSKEQTCASRSGPCGPLSSTAAVTAQQQPAPSALAAGAALGAGASCSIRNSLWPRRRQRPPPSPDQCATRFGAAGTAMPCCASQFQAACAPFTP